MAFIPTQYNNPIFVYSLRKLVTDYFDPLVRVIRESDFVEVDVLPDSNDEISYDSVIVRNNDTLATTLGEFLNIDGYTDADSLGSVYEGRLAKVYDQSAGTFDIDIAAYGDAFLFVETNLAEYNGSTAIHKVNGIPTFRPQALTTAFQVANVREREVSYHFLVEGTQSGFFGIVDSSNTLAIQGLHNYTLERTYTSFISPSTPSDWDVNDVYFDSVVSTNITGSLYESNTWNNFDTAIITVEAAIKDNAVTQSAFPDNIATFRLVQDNWYCDLIAFDDYDPIRRLTIEGLYADASSNASAFSRTSKLLLNAEDPTQSGFLAQFPNAAAAYSVRSLTGNTGTDGPKVVRVRRDSDNVEVDVYTDDTGFITLDSPIANTTEYTDATVNAPFDTSCTVLGQFVNNAEYDDIDNLGSPDTATVVAWYDQSSTDTVSALPTDAAAAYSVRKLFNGYSGSALKIRRDSDNATQDIGFDFDGNLDVQAIEDFVREGVVGADYPSDLLLDIVPEGEQSAPEAAAAYSLRRLRNIYGFAPLIRVRRDSDHAEADVYAHKLVDGSLQTMDFIGLDSIVLATDEITNPDTPVPSDEVTLMDFARGANLTVVVWYDQAHDYNANWYNTSTDQNNAVQEIGGNQPKIYDEFTGLITENGKPAVDFTNVNGVLIGSPVLQEQDLSLAIVMRQNDLGVSLSTTTNTTSYFRLFSATTIRVRTADGLNDYVGTSSGYQNQSLYFMSRNLTDDITVFIDSAQIGSSATRSGGFGVELIGGDSASFRNVLFQEIILYPSDQSTNRPELEKNINNAYEIYGGWRATVETWYDQANNNHATQANPLSQPTIYDNGGVVTENGKFAVDFDGIDDVLSKNTELATPANLSIVSVFNLTTRSNSQRIYHVRNTTDNITMAVDLTDGIAFRSLSNDTSYNGPFSDISAQSLFFHVDSDTLHKNSNLVTDKYSSSLGVTGASGIYLGARANGNNHASVRLQEFLLYPSNKSDNRPTIEKNINSYYNIYIDNAATQQVAGSQPTLVSSGELVKENGRVAFQFDGDKLETTGTESVITFHTATQGMLYSVVNVVSDTGVYNSIAVNNGTSSNLSGFSFAIDDRFGADSGYYQLTQGFSSGALALSNGATFAGNQKLMAVHYDLESGIFSYADGALLSSVTGNKGYGTGPSGRPLGIGTVINLRAKMQELVLYNSDDTNRPDIESNINSAFQIYSAAFPSALDTVPEAKAAYSVRRLTKEYTGPIITVSNGSTTKDFYADFWGNLDKTALTDFANGNPLDITKWWDQSGREEHLVATGGSKPTLDPSTLNISVDDTNKFDDNAIITDINNSYDPDNEIYLLDEYSGAAAAYSLRKLRAGYTGPLVRVRKDGDNNAEVDVYPDANGTISTSSPVTDVTEITDTNPSVVSNETTFGDFMSGYDGKVVVWYDQSADFTADWYTNPNSQNNAVQDVSGSQPKVYDSVTGVITRNGKPAILSAVSSMLTFSQVTAATTFAVYQMDNAASKAIHYLLYNSSAIKGYFTGGSITQGIGVVDGSVKSSTAGKDTNPHLGIWHYNGTNYNVAIDGDSLSSLPNGSDFSVNNIGRATDVDLSIDGGIHEIVMYSSSQIANRTGIERDINRHYQIYDQTNRVVAVHNGDVQRTVDLNVATYTDLKEIIHYQ